MTGKLDSRMRALAQRLIDEFGKPITLRRQVTEYDPGLGTTTTTNTDHAINGVIGTYSENRIDGTVVKIGDLQVEIPAQDLTVVPDQTKDKILVDGEEWSIVSTPRIYSGEQVAVYRFQIRK